MDYSFVKCFPNLIRYFQLIDQNYLRINLQLHIRQIKYHMVHVYFFYCSSAKYLPCSEIVSKIYYPSKILPPSLGPLNKFPVITRTRGIFRSQANAPSGVTKRTRLEIKGLPIA